MVSILAKDIFLEYGAISQQLLKKPLRFLKQKFTTLSAKRRGELCIKIGIFCEYYRNRHIVVWVFYKVYAVRAVTL